MQVSQRTSCIWIYLWLLDKITKIDPVTGMGIVLGGEPIKVEDLALFGDRKTVMKILARLESEGYIKTTRTPYGKVIRVTKAKKSFGWKVERYPTSGTPEVPESVHLRATRGTSNKTIQLDSNKDIPAKRGKPMKKNKIGKYNEASSSDSYEEAIDIDSGEKISEPKSAGTDVYWELLRWGEERRGSPFFKTSIKKQFKAFSLAKAEEIMPDRLQERWQKFEKDKFWIEKGFDWMDVVMSFNKKNYE